jgi:hypothetical protein
MLKSRLSQGDQLAQASPRFDKENNNYFKQSTIAGISSDNLKHLSSNPSHHKMTSLLKLHQDLKKKIKNISIKSPTPIPAVVISST